MDKATTEEKFYHAVELIKSLPKSGNFQPSNDVKLKFYSYFKQATEGPCSIPKPSFWDVITRAKWDAWNRLGTMSKEDAMKNYVDEFVQILKATPFDEAARDYVHIMGPYIDLAPKEFREKHGRANGFISEGTGVSHNDCEGPSINGHNVSNNESDTEEFSDTFDEAKEGMSEEDILVPTVMHNSTSNPSVAVLKVSSITEARGGANHRVAASDINSQPDDRSGNRGNRRNSREQDDYATPGSSSYGYPQHSAGGGRRDNNPQARSADINEQLAFAVIRLQHTMEQVVTRLDSLEALLQENRAHSCMSQMKNTCWSVFGIPYRTTILILIWPFVAQWLIHMIKKRRNR